MPPNSRYQYDVMKSEIAMTIIVALCTGVVVLSLNGGGLGMFDFLRDNLMPVLGGMAVLALVCAGVGFFLGKKS